MNNILFIGSGEFGVPFLEFLLEKQDIKIIAVITQPDKPAGRGKKFQPTPIKKIALTHNLKILQPENINSSEVYNFIIENNVKLNVVISYGQILKKEIIFAPEFSSINVHPSLLPKNRGASPIQNALLNGEKETGISIIEMNEKMDSGDILAQLKVDISIDDDFYSLSDKLQKSGKELLYNTIEKIFSSEVEKIKQRDSEATYCKKISKEDGLIDWNNTSLNIYNQIRAFIHWPVSFTFHKNRLIKIYKATLTDLKFEYNPGTIYRIDKKNFGVICGDKRLLKIEKLQIQGKKILNSSDFLNGYPLETGDIFTGEPR